MYSENYLEVILTSVGWDFYSKVTYFIWALNLHLVPLILIMLNNWRSTLSSQEMGTASVVEMRRNFFDVGIAMGVILLFWMPNAATTYKPAEYIEQIQNANVSQSENPEENAQKFTAAQQNMGVTADEIPIPPGWFVIINSTKAAVNQLKEWLDFSKQASAMFAVMGSMKVDDPKVQDELNRFISSCYLPAMARYQNRGDIPVGELSQKDIRFVGNSVFLTTPGLYKACTQQNINDGMCLGDPLTMPVEYAEQSGIETTFTNSSAQDQNGRDLTSTSTPSCYQWWTANNDDDHYKSVIYEHPGLRDATFDAVANDAMSMDDLGDKVDGLVWYASKNAADFLDWSQSNFGVGDSSTAKDLTIQMAMRNGTHELIADPDEPNPVGIEEKTKQAIVDGANWVSDIAVFFSAIKWATIFSTILRALEPGLMMIQAGLIFGSLMFMAFTLPISGFSAGSVIKHAMFILGALMLPLIWHVASMMQEGLIRILYPDAYNLLDLDINLKSMLFMIFLFMLYFILPTVFMRMMSLSGYETAQATSEAISGLSNPGRSGGSFVAGKATGLVGSQTSKAAKGVGGAYTGFVNKYNPK